MLDQNYNYMDNVVTVGYTIAFICITLMLIQHYRTIINNPVVRPIDTTRVNEGLPTDISLSPEDFAADPELAEIFGITDNNTTLDFTLESDEHFEQVQIDIEAQNRENIINALNDLNNGDYLLNLYDDLTMTFNFFIHVDYPGLLFNYLLSVYDEFSLIYLYIINSNYIGTIYDLIVAFISYFN